MSRRNSRMIESQLKKIDEIFRESSNAETQDVKVLDIQRDKNCNVHGNVTRRGSAGLSRKGSMASNYEVNKRNSFCSTDSLNRNKLNRNSIGSFTELIHRPSNNGFRKESIEQDIFQKYRRGSTPTSQLNRSKRNSLDTWNSKLFKGLEHPSSFPTMLRSSSSSTQLNTAHAKNENEKLSVSRRSSSQWSVNSSNSSNMDKKLLERNFKRDFTSPTVDLKNKKEPVSILRKKRSEDELKEIMKRLSFDYIENEVRNGRKSVESDLFSDNTKSSEHSSHSPIVTPSKVPRRVSIDSLESRRSSRCFSDFSINGDDDIDEHVLFKNRNNSKHSQVIPCRLILIY